MTDKQKYNKAGESLVDWVEQCKKAELDAAITSTLLLDSAIDLCFHVMGTEKAMEAVDTMMRLKLREYDRCDGDEGLERN